MTNITDAAGNVVETLYNGLGFVTNIAIPTQNSPFEGGSRGMLFASFEFDNSGRLTHEKDFHGRESSISYNANERKTTVIRPDSTTVKTQKDTQGRIVSVVSSGEVSRTRNFTYRNDGKLQNFGVTFAGDYVFGNCLRNSAGELYQKYSYYDVDVNEIAMFVNYGRDIGGLVNSVTFDIMENYSQTDIGITRTYTRDEMGRIERVQAGDVDVSYNYNSDGRIQSMWYPGNWYKSFSYDNAGRMTGSDYHHTYNQQPDSYTINNQYDPYAAARMKQQQISFNGTPTHVHNYGYDIIDQITSEEILADGNQIDYNSYSYNGFGDRTNYNGIRVSYYNSRISWYKDNLDYYYYFDQRGNLDSRVVEEDMEPEVERTEFSYDSDNNMIGAEVNGTNWTFRYNANNQMYYSKVSDGSTIDERFYIYDGLDCIAETDTAGTILREYIRIGNVGGIVAEIRHNDSVCAPGYQSGTFYYHYNHRGDVIAVTKSDGTIVFKADYDAYGKQFTANSLPLTDFKPRYTFSTKRFFKELGLYYYGYRWYIPELGRWTTKDPLGLKAGLNAYKFCKNNPLYYIDSFGQWGQAVWEIVIQAYEVVVTHPIVTKYLADPEFYNELGNNIMDTAELFLDEATKPRDLIDGADISAWQKDILDRQFNRGAYAPDKPEEPTKLEEQETAPMPNVISGC